MPDPAWLQYEAPRDRIPNIGKLLDVTSSDKHVAVSKSKEKSQMKLRLIAIILLTCPLAACETTPTRPKTALERCVEDAAVQRIGCGFRELRTRADENCVQQELNLIEQCRRVYGR